VGIGGALYLKVSISGGSVGVLSLHLAGDEKRFCKVGLSTPHVEKDSGFFRYPGDLPAMQVDLSPWLLRLPDIMRDGVRQFVASADDDCSARRTGAALRLPDTKRRRRLRRTLSGRGLFALTVAVVVFVDLIHEISAR
jgi:hypothetical protein